MIKPLGRLADSFWRAAAYCLHPRVIGWLMLPLILIGVVSFGLGWFFWEGAVAGVRGTLESWSLVAGLLKWLDDFGASGLRTVIAPIIVIVMVSPLLVVLCLLLVATMMTPSMADLVAQRRFPGLARKHGAGLVASLSWGLGHTVPPLVLGWLTYRVFTFDVLGDFASGPERRRLLAEHRLPLLGLGLATGYLGAAPAAIWAFGALAFILAPLLIVVFVFLSTLVFAFSSLWFSHYALAALQELRRADTLSDRVPDPVMDALPANYATAPPRLADDAGAEDDIDDPKPGSPPVIENRPSPL
jgi:hypothetical protein